MSISTYLDEALGDWWELLRGWASSGAVAEEGQDFVLLEKEAK